MFHVKVKNGSRHYSVLFTPERVKASRPTIVPPFSINSPVNKADFRRPFLTLAHPCILFLHIDFCSPMTNRFYTHLPAGFLFILFYSAILRCFVRLRSFIMSGGRGANAFAADTHVYRFAYCACATASQPRQPAFIQSRSWCRVVKMN